MLEFIGARLLVTLQAEYLAGEERVGSGTGAKAGHPTALRASPAVFINQLARAAHIRMAVRKALAFALASGFLPGLQDEDLRDCHIFNIYYGSKTGDIQITTPIDTAIFLD